MLQPKAPPPVLRQIVQKQNMYGTGVSEDELKGFQDEFKKLRDEGQSETVAAITARQRRLGSSGRKD